MDTKTNCELINRRDTRKEIHKFWLESEYVDNWYFTYAINMVCNILWEMPIIENKEKE